MKKLILENFKGIPALNIDLEKKTVVRGTNGTGKTTILDAICWAVTGKDSSGRADHEIKTRQEGSFKKDASHSVEIHGEGWAFRRVYVPKWDEGVLKGHATEYFVDRGNGLEPASKTSKRGSIGYDEYVAEKMGGSNFTMLSDTGHFAEKMHWKERRQVVFEVAGSVSDDEIIKTFPTAEQEKLNKWLFDMDASDVKLSLKKSMKELEELKYKLEIKLEEAKLKVPVINKEALLEIMEEIGILKSIRKKKQVDLENIRFADDLKEKLSKAKDALRSAKTIADDVNSRILEEHRRVEAKAQEGYYKELEELRKKVSVGSENIYVVERENSRADREKKSLEDKLENIRKMFYEAKESSWNGETKCRACGQDLPGDGIEKQKEEFNEKRAARMLALKKEGEEVKQKIEALPALADTSHLRNELKELEEKISTMKKPEVNRPELRVFDDSKFVAEIYEIQQEIKKAEETVAERRNEAQKEVDKIDEEILQKNLELKIEEVWKETTHRVKQIENELDDVRKNIVAKKLDLILIGKFLVAKVNTLESEVEKAFGVKFEMFRHNLTNDDFVEVCEVMVNVGGDYVPYNTVNRARAINTGIKLCGVLQNHYKINVPIIVDNAESVVQIEPTDKQILLLMVDGNAKKLEVVR